MTAGNAVGDDFFAGVLQQIGAPATASNIAILREWSRYEGTSAAWNPMATTTYEPGATAFNSVGVRNFASEQTGIAGTAATLTNGYYPDVVAALRANQPLSFWQHSPQIQAQISKWGTHGFARALAAGGGGGGGGGGSSAPAPATGSFLSAPRATSKGGASGSVWGYAWQGTQCATLAQTYDPSAGNASGINGFAFWIGQSCVQTRLAFYGLAVGLIYFGVKFIGVPVPG